MNNLKRDSFTHIGKRTLERLQKVTIPNTPQRLVLENLTRYMYILIHRQKGKTHLIRQLGLDYLESDIFKDLPPRIGIFTQKLKQARKLFTDRFDRAFEDLRSNLSKDDPRYKASWDIEKGSHQYLRHDHKLCGVDMYQYSTQVDKDRGGTYPIAFIDEYASTPEDYLLSVVSPMTDTFQGQTLCFGTPLGPNHFKTEFEYAEAKMNSGDKDFFALRWTIDDSVKAGEMSSEERDTIQKRYPPGKEHIYRAEYLLDWHAYVPDQIFRYELKEARDQHRIGNFPYNPSYPVDLFWDIGVNGTAVWFRQSYAGKHFFIDYKEECRNAHLIRFLKKHIYPLLNRYRFRFCVWPFDIQFSDFSAEEGRMEVARKNLPSLLHRPGPQIRKPLDAIDQARRGFNRCYFNESTCALGLTRLTLYHMKGSLPAKDIHSHGADAFILSELLNDLYSLKTGQDISSSSRLDELDTGMRNFKIKRRSHWTYS